MCRARTTKSICNQALGSRIHRSYLELRTVPHDAVLVMCWLSLRATVGGFACPEIMENLWAEYDMFPRKSGSFPSFGFKVDPL